MSQHRIINGVNFNLFLSGVLLVLMLFAPLAYVANYANNTYAWMSGAWVTVERSGMMGENIRLETIAFYGSIPMLFHTLLTVGAAALLFSITLFNRNPFGKLRLIWGAIGLMVLQIFMALWMYWGIEAYVGEGLPSEIEARMQAEFFLHVFPPIFCMLAWGRASRNVK